jgi:Transcriptional regulator C-terminal region
LLRRSFETLRRELADAQRAARAKTAGSQGEPLGFSLAMFEHASGYTDVFRALVDGRGGTVAVSEIRHILSDLVRKELLLARNGGATSRELVAQFVVGAFLSVLTWWLERSPRLTPSEVDVMFRRLVLHGITPINAKSRV